ncbi:MAG: PaaI family thioesterase [Variibacter sp.]
MSAKTPMTIADMQAIMDSSPFIRFFGIRIVSADPAASTIVAEITLRPEMERMPGTGQWHGGALSGFIDTVGDFALVMGAGGPLPTINFRVDYLRPATTATLTATARVRRSGRTVGVVDIDVEDSEKRLVAVGRGCYGSQPG